MRCMWLKPDKSLEFDKQQLDTQQLEVQQLETQQIYTQQLAHSVHGVAD